MAEKLCQLKKKGGGSGDLYPIEIQIFRDVINIIQNSASSLTFHAENTYNASYPSTSWPAQWHIEGSNDLSTWTTLLDRNHTGHTNYNTDISVNISGYKYLKFGSDNQGFNYQNLAKFKNITFA